MNNTGTLTDVQLKAVMSDDELKLWEALPPATQLAKLRAAIEEGVASGVSEKSMDELFEEALARHPHVSI